MKNVFDEIGLEGIVFIAIILICVLVLKISATYSVVIAFIGAVVTWLIKRGKITKK